MPDRNNSLALESCATSRPSGETTQQDAVRTGELSAWPHLALVPAACPDAGSRTSSVSSQAPGRKSHLERLVDALHTSRRIQAARVTRQYLHLVQE